MPLTQINLTPDAPLTASGAKLDTDALAGILAQAGQGPVVTLLHGFKFSPFVADACPHSHILGLSPRKARRAISWPRHLGFTGVQEDEGLCLAVGWHARGSIWQAFREAEAAGHRLGDVLATLHRVAPERPVSVVAHSLGARVFFTALRKAPAGSVARAVLLTGAEFRDSAARAMESPAGQSVEVLNVTSRENDLYDWMLERLIAPQNPFRRTLGHGLRARPARWLDVQIDDPTTLSALRGLGFPVAAPQRRICHWSSYLRPGLFPLYTAYLRTPERLPLNLLREALPQPQAWRWSRMLALPPLPLPALRRQLR